MIMLVGDKYDDSEVERHDVDRFFVVYFLIDGMVLLSVFPLLVLFVLLPLLKCSNEFVPRI